MIDTHEIMVNFENWGIRPILFSFWDFDIPSHAFFTLLGLIVGLLFFYYEARKNKVIGENTFYLLVAALVGGVIGAKIPILILEYKYILANFPNISPIIFSGKTITGGLVGGFLAVILIKKILNIKVKRGNLFAPAIAIGVAIGRIGCFLRGDAYGIPTSLPWGVNFGDGVMRHPTQIYESVFMLGMFFYFQHAKTKNPAPGVLFENLMIFYFIFRFFIEFIRVEKVIFLGLTLFQLISLVVVIYFLAIKSKTFINKKKVNNL